MSRTFDAFKQAEAEQSSTGSDAEPSSTQDRDPDVASGELTIDLHPRPNVEEIYQKLRGTLFGRFKSNRIKTLLVVASAHGEGATTTSSCLASVLARANHSRVLLVDANLRTPSPWSLRQRHRGSPGFTDLVSGKVPLGAVIQPVSSTNSRLSIITSGTPLPAPSYIFDSDAIDTALEELGKRYDYVILDGAPVRDFSDSCFLSSKVDGTVIVVEFGKTRLDTVRATKNQLERYGANVLGTVFNKKPNYIPAFLERFL